MLGSGSDPQEDEFQPSEASAALSAFEYTFNMLTFGFSRWSEACMDAANVSGLTSLDILVLHAVNHRARGRRVSDICTVLNIGDSYLVSYALKKLLAAGLITAERRGRERHYTTLEAGDRACLDYRRIRERNLVNAIFPDKVTAEGVREVTKALSHLIACYDEASRAATTEALSKPKLPPLRTKK
jgi:predicted MarR family transcription regulator